MVNLLNLHKANKIEKKVLNSASCIILELISISDNFVENVKKVTKLIHKGGGGGG